MDKGTKEKEGDPFLVLQLLDSTTFTGPSYSSCPAVYISIMHALCTVVKICHVFIHGTCIKVRAKTCGYQRFHVKYAEQGRKARAGDGVGSVPGQLPEKTRDGQDWAEWAREWREDPQGKADRLVDQWEAEAKANGGSQVGQRGGEGRRGVPLSCEASAAQAWYTLWFYEYCSAVCLKLWPLS